DFGGEREPGAYRLERWSLPGRVGVDAPLAEYLGHLRAVIDTLEIWMRSVHQVAERAQDHPGGDHRRAHADAALCMRDPIGDYVRHPAPAPGREEDMRLDGTVLVGNGDTSEVVLPAALDTGGFPQLTEVLRVLRRQRWGRDLHDDVLLSGPGIIRPVHGSGPDRCRIRRAIAHDVFVVHQVGNARHGFGRHPQTGDELRVGLRRRRYRNRVGKVDVVEQPDRHAASRARLDCGAQPLGRRAGQVQVVDGDVEAAPGAV